MRLTKLKLFVLVAKKATMNIRIDADGKRINEGAQVQIGREESYVSVCRADFFKGI